MQGFRNTEAQTLSLLKEFEGIDITLHANILISLIYICYIC